jgi:hypothetical protein
VVIRVSIENVVPLTGSMAGESGETVRFEGWLGLLGVLSELVGAAGQPDDRQKQLRPADSKT